MYLKFKESPDGVKSKIGQFDHDEEDGHWTEWYESGKVKTEGEFENGLMDGKWEGFYRNGVKKYGTHYSNNLKNGSFIQFYKNGKTGISGSYKNDAKVGLWTDWHDKGATIRQKGSYKLISKKKAPMSATVPSGSVRNGSPALMQGEITWRE